jgi:hypothetical protein
MSQPSGLSRRFWAKVDRRGPDRCWEWTGKLAKGYGSIRWCGQWLLAHRLSYVWTHGAIQDGLLVIHSCDNPKCVNPAHLRLGTHRDNALDTVERGQWANQYRPRQPA